MLFAVYEESCGSSTAQGVSASERLYAIAAWGAREELEWWDWLPATKVVADERDSLLNGSGKLLCEFLHVDDLPDTVVLLMENYSGLDDVNDSSKPDGRPKKLMDNSKLAAIGWEAKIYLKEGLKDTYKWYLENAVN
ncbi:unnamed protein product [Fraxinus pennsylvanica]|uniref:Uncharacterized protein n=1 Tax=Fraxinus pennsylvanica TaxID=56036 RepID=A0AAD2DNF1_9LAMI|nr:unnamed protein product [Fraxinus pennsylvanica]